MGLADDIRDFVFEKYIKPARGSGVSTVKVRAGDIHEEMGLKRKLPSVCGSLGTKKFLNQHNLNLENREGPSCGSDVFFTYKIN
ncbi:MAG: hypothetical protein GWN31_13835 [Candidatus Thorarchaeota archaeon]|nr:hypothetical protein [Candidatus Thorarchaeota archaeon]NIW14976.1 hypothetical protein [Candidatus Thorarchaeota archaeon]NIW52987.1 hypothetical protein [Candidatus Korarchaeota archaeon]